jgi:hypothetical protein
MTIYRGPGGGGNATVDTDLNILINLRDDAQAAANVADASADAAAISETNAANSANAASSSASITATLYDSFDDRYLGAKTSAPTTDNDGDALLTGALYFNSVSSEMFVYDGTTWSAIVVDSSDFVRIIGNQSIDGVKTFTSTIVGDISGNAATATNATTVTNGVYTTGSQTITGSKRGAVTTDNDLSFDMNAGNNFSCTTSGSGTLTFTNITAGQSGFILLVNASNHTISAHANTKINAADLATISVTGTYLLSYFSNGTDVFVAASRGLA